MTHGKPRGTRLKLYSFKSLFCCFVFVSSLLFGHTVSANTEYETQAKNIISEFKQALQTELKSAIKLGGFEKAIHVCNEKAPSIQAKLLSKEGVHIGRTSLKLRNQNNAPDDWEKSILNQFEISLEKGVAFDQLETSLETDQTYRFMKAIPMQGICMNCHGTNVKPDLYTVIQRYYPDDQAIGFRGQDIRGAFTVSIPIKPIN